MTKTAFSKTLSANDVGAAGGHMGGILIPKGEGRASCWRSCPGWTPSK